jgi:hypothetical protein
MKKNNDSIKFQSNSQQPRIKVDLANLLEDPCLRTNKREHRIACQA